MADEDLYGILEVPRNASMNDIRKVEMLSGFISVLLLGMAVVSQISKTAPSRQKRRRRYEGNYYGCFAYDRIHEIPSFS